MITASDLGRVQPRRRYYGEFRSAVQQQRAALRAPLEKKLRDQVKLAKWDEQTCVALHGGHAAASGLIVMEARSPCRIRVPCAVTVQLLFAEGDVRAVASCSAQGGRRLRRHAGATCQACHRLGIRQSS